MTSRFTLVVLAIAAAAAAGFADDLPAENLALGKPYTLSPRPNYRYCTDPEDRVQLTDGQYSRGYFWTQKSTVGWNHDCPVVITVDLGKSQPIRGASFNTAAGVAGVEWPISIDLLVSDDGKSYRHAGDLLAMSQKQRPAPGGKYAVHRYWTDQIRAHGRYVSFVVAPTTYCFVDEVEIYRGEEAWMSDPAPAQSFTDPRSFYAGTSVRRAFARRIGADIAVVRSLVQKHEPDPKGLAGELDAMEAQIASLPDPPAPPADFRAVLPLNDLHRKVFDVRARLCRMPDLSRLEPPVIATVPHDPLAYLALPDAPLAPLREIEVRMMRGEYRSAAFALLPRSDRPIGISVAGLPGGENPTWVSVRKVQWTDTRAGNPVADALVPMKLEGGRYTLAAVPGLYQQIWLTFHPADVPPGTHRGTLRIDGLVAGPAAPIEVPITLGLSSLKFPERTTLHLGGWDYTDADNHYEITSANRDAVIAHLREHFVDSPWASAAALPHGKHGPDGKMIAPPDTGRFDTWVGRWPDAGQYCVFASVPGRFGSFEMGSPQFAVAVGEWIRFWADHAKKRGIEPRRLAMLIVDEPHSAEQDATILAWAKAIRAAGTGVLIWEDPTHQDPHQASQEMMAACDVLCPNRPMFLSNAAYRKYFSEDRPKNTALSFYSCSGPVRGLDPYSYHRLQAWSCFEQGAVGMYYWAFGDGGGGSSWNEYAAARHGYSPSFLDSTSVVSSKHMEAIREGVEDYEYLALLRREVGRLAERAAGRPEFQAAENLLADGPARVLGAAEADRILWNAAKDRSVADQVRVQVLDALERLSAIK